MTIQQVLNKGKKILTENNIEEASLISRMLLSYMLKCKKEDLLIKQDEEISEKQVLEFINNIEKISKGYPIQYITHSKEFMGMDFYVDENVLVPRPDTEVLVEEVITLAKDNLKKDILELCTGSGSIAISLVRYLEDANITATDISKKALEVAIKNEESLLKDRKINFIQSDMYENIDQKYDIIVSNPPYIKTEVIKQYNLKYEPNLALDGGIDGLKFYRIIIEEGYKYLEKNGIIALEIGFDQRDEVIEIANKTGKFKKIYCKKDLFGNDRVIVMEV